MCVICKFGWYKFEKIVFYFVWCGAVGKSKPVTYAEDVCIYGHGWHFEVDILHYICSFLTNAWQAH